MARPRPRGRQLLPPSCVVHSVDVADEEVWLGYRCGDLARESFPWPTHPFESKRVKATYVHHRGVTVAGERAHLIFSPRDGTSCRRVSPDMIVCE